MTSPTPGDASLGYVNPFHPDWINRHFGQRGCSYGQEILHPSMSTGLGTAASRRAPKRGALGSCCFSWGAETQQSPPSCLGKASAEEPLSAKVLPQHLLPQSGAGWG